MPIVIHRADPQPKEVFDYDKVVGAIVFVVVGLWIVESTLGVLLLGSINGMFPKGMNMEGDIAEANRALLLSLLKVFGFGGWFAFCAIGIRNGLKYGFWLFFPAGLALVVLNRLPDSEQTLMESSFALLAMGYCAWRLVGWAGPKLR